MIGRRLRRVLVGICALLLAAAGAVGLWFVWPHSTVTITLDPGQRFQTIRDWETTAEVFWTPDYEPFRQDIYERLVTQIGISRVRLETFSGAENTDQSFEKFRSGEIDMQGWRDRRYTTVNDDADPFHINPAGFDWANLDWRIDNHLLPILAAGKKHGERIDINFCYVAFTKQIKSGVYIHTDPEEYAEFILAAFLHMREKYGIVPDYFEPLLEPDNVKEWTPHSFGVAIAAATRRLKEAGFAPKIVMPSVTNIHNAIPWLKEIEKVPGAMDLANEFSYHRYYGGEIKVLKSVHERAAERGLETAMLEYWGGKGTYDLLHNDLKYAQVSAWQGRTALTQHKIDLSRPKGDQLVLSEDVRYTVQYTHYIRPGAVRIGAGSSADDWADPLAFVNPDGGTVVEVKAEGAGPIAVRGLPEGDYKVSWAVASGSGALPEAVHVGPDGLLQAKVPGKGVLTISPAALP